LTTSLSQANWPQGVLLVNNSNVTFSGKTQFAFNGGDLVLGFVSSRVVFEGKTKFVFNKGIDVIVIADLASVRFKAAVYFIQNEAVTSSPVSVFDSLLYFQDDATFLMNHGKRGGAISLSGSFMLVYSHTSIQFIKNHANYYGGAIDMINSDLCTRRGVTVQFLGK